MSIESMTADNPGPLFDAAASEDAKRTGIENATSPLIRQVRLLEARLVAFDLASGGREISADDVAEHYSSTLHIDLWEHLGNAAGAIFQTDEWEFVRYVKSQRVRSHSNLIRVWRLR